METIDFDRYQPDHEGRCENCGHSPTVSLVADEVVIHNTGLCGPCTFGTARALDPEAWNSLDD